MLIQLSDLWGQRSTQHFYHIGIEDGLSQSSVQAICQDKVGFLWLGTKDGLNRYDGNEFIVFRNNPQDSNSISSNNITALTVDSLGFIWIGSNSGFLNKYNPQTGNFQQVTYLPNTHLKQKIKNLYIDKDNNLWICTSGNGLIFYNISEETFEVLGYKETTFDPRPINNYVQSITQDVEGFYWVAYERGGVSKMSSDKKVEKVYPIKHPLTKDVVNSINSIITDLHGDIWLGTYHGIYWLNKSKDDFEIRFPMDGANPTVVSILPYSENIMWMSVFGKGLVKYDISTNETIFLDYETCNSDNSNTLGLSRLYKDRTGNIWIGTNGSGLFRVNGVQNFTLNQANENDPFSIQHNSIRAIIVDQKNRTYIGSYSGLSIFDNHNGLYKHFESTHLIDPKKLRNNAVYSLAERKDGKVWVGLEGFGLQLYDPETELFKYYDPDVMVPDSVRIHNHYIFDLFISSDDELWLGTANGLIKHNEQEDTFERIDLQLANGIIPFVRHILEDKHGFLWLATENGLICYNPKTHYVKHYEKLIDGSLANHPAVNIFSLLLLNDQIILCTDGYGLINATPNKNNTEVQFNQILPDALKGIVVYACLTDDNNQLWFSTNSGLYSYNQETQAIDNYTINDGLQSNEFNAAAFYKDENGNMYFGGINGLNSFNPKDINISKTSPNAVITDISILGKPYFAKNKQIDGTTIYLDYNNNFLTVEFAALDFTAPEKNQYAFKLEGYNNNWMEIGTRKTAEFTNLPPGSYTFKVKGSNSYGVWSKQNAEFNINIASPVWQTFYFRFLVGLAIVTLAFTILRIWYQQQQRSKIKLIEKIKNQEQNIQIERLKTEYAVSKAMIEGQNNEQKRISEDLHDGLGQTLTAATLNLAALENDLGELTKRQKEYLLSLKKLMNIAIHDVRNISHNLMPNLLQEEGLEAVLEELCNRIGKSAKLKISLRITGFEKRLDPNIEITIYRIVQEIINNAIKHASATTLQIQLLNNQRKVTLIAVDDGVGFDTKHHRKNGIGLQNIRVRAELLKGAMHIDSIAGKGTTIKIEIPIVS